MNDNSSNNSQKSLKNINKFIKYDSNKIRYDLVPPSAIRGMGEVLTQGLLKYPEHNWKNCDNKDRYIAALYRHLEAWRSGEINDPETNLHHLKHAMTNVAFLIDLDYNPSNWKQNQIN